MILPSVSAVEFNTDVESIKDVVSDIQSKSSTNKRMQLLQHFIKSSDNKYGTFDIFPWLYLFMLIAGFIMNLLFHTGDNVDLFTK